MNSCFDSSGKSDSEDEPSVPPISTDKRRKKLGKEKQKSAAKSERTEDSSNKRTSKYKESLNRLLEKDPSFKNFLKEHDADLLNYQSSSSGGEETDEELDQIDDNDDDQKSDLPDKEPVQEKQEEVFSSSSDEHDDGDSRIGLSEKTFKSGDGRSVLTRQTVKEWDKNLRKQPSFATIRSVIHAFRAAVERSGADVESDQFVVEDSTSFNAIVRLCFTTMEKSLVKLLKLDSVESGLKPDFFGTNSHQKWKRYKSDFRMYLSDLILLLAELQEAVVISVTLKHMGKLEVLYCAFPKLARQAIKQFVKVWSRKEESCRVLAILNISKLLRRNTDLLDYAIKSLYFAFVQNTKLVTADTWPLIQFMQGSHAEVCALDPEVSYRHAFVYIRQLAIHLRNAMISTKKELVQAVYNWQFIQSLYLWSTVLSRLIEEEGLRDLVYPLIQILMGCIKLVPSAKYYPLRFHCCRILIQLAKSASVYIPVIPEILEPLKNVTLLNKRHTKRSAKPMSFDCCLKLSKSQLEKNGFRDTVVETVYELMVEAVKCESASLAFPEMVVPCLAQEELEVELNLVESPFKKFYASWKKMKAREMQVQALAAKQEPLENASHEVDDSDEQTEKNKSAKKQKRKPDLKIPEEQPEKKKKVSSTSEIILPKFEDLVQDLELSD